MELNCSPTKDLSRSPKTTKNEPDDGVRSKEEAPPFLSAFLLPWLPTVKSKQLRKLTESVQSSSSATAAAELDTKLRVCYDSQIRHVMKRHEREKVKLPMKVLKSASQLGLSQRTLRMRWLSRQSRKMCKRQKQKEPIAKPTILSSNLPDIPASFANDDTLLTFISELMPMCRDTDSTFIPVARHIVKACKIAYPSNSQLSSFVVKKLVYHHLLHGAHRIGGVTLPLPSGRLDLLLACILFVATEEMKYLLDDPSCFQKLVALLQRANLLSKPGFLPYFLDTFIVPELLPCLPKLLCNVYDALYMPLPASLQNFSSPASDSIHSVPPGSESQLVFPASYDSAVAESLAPAGNAALATRRPKQIRVLRKQGLQAYKPGPLQNARAKHCAHSDASRVRKRLFQASPARPESDVVAETPYVHRVPSKHSPDSKPNEAVSIAETPDKAPFSELFTKEPKLKKNNSFYLTDGPHAWATRNERRKIQRNLSSSFMSYLADGDIEDTEGSILFSQFSNQEPPGLSSPSHNTRSHTRHEQTTVLAGHNIEIPKLSGSKRSTVVTSGKRRLFADMDTESCPPWVTASKERSLKILREHIPAKRSPSRRVTPRKRTTPRKSVTCFGLRFDLESGPEDISPNQQENKNGSARSDASVEGQIGKHGSDAENVHSEGYSSSSNLCLLSDATTDAFTKESSNPISEDSLDQPDNSMLGSASHKRTGEQRHMTPSARKMRRLAFSSDSNCSLGVETMGTIVGPCADASSDDTCGYTDSGIDRSRGDLHTVETNVGRESDGSTLPQLSPDKVTEQPIFESPYKLRKRPPSASPKTNRTNKRHSSKLNSTDAALSHTKNPSPTFSAASDVATWTLSALATRATDLNPPKSFSPLSSQGLQQLLTSPFTSPSCGNRGGKSTSSSPLIQPRQLPMSVDSTGTMNISMLSPIRNTRSSMSGKFVPRITRSTTYQWHVK